MLGLDTSIESNVPGSARGYVPQRRLAQIRGAIRRLRPKRATAAAEVTEAKEPRLIAAMADLPARTREAFVLHRFQSMPYAAVAARMGIPVGAVERHIMRAIRRLADATA